VVAPTLVDVVRCAGGLLVDRVLAGWETTVLVTDPADTRPLRILGARPVDLESALASPGPVPRAEEIAVDASLCGSDDRVRRMVQEALYEGSADVRLWGGPCPAKLEHRLSFAARAFKAQALAAAAAPFESIDVELFNATRDVGIEPAMAVAGTAVSHVAR
jgi:hypothetical protein